MVKGTFYIFFYLGPIYPYYRALECFYSITAPPSGILIMISDLPIKLSRGKIASCPLIPHIGPELYMPGKPNQNIRFVK